MGLLFRQKFSTRKKPADASSETGQRPDLRTYDRRRVGPRRQTLHAEHLCAFAPYVANLLLNQILRQTQNFPGVFSVTE